MGKTNEVLRKNTAFFSLLKFVLRVLLGDVKKIASMPFQLGAWALMEQFD